MNSRRLFVVCLLSPVLVFSQHAKKVTFEKRTDENRIDIFIGKKRFTQFIYADSLEKPVLFPIYDASGVAITRGFPVSPKPGDPTDHPHHIGLWFNFENVNGLDFWNNSYAIPPDKKSLYGWIKTNQITERKEGETGILGYRANWVNQSGEILLHETTRFEISGNDSVRTIDRITELLAETDIHFADAKDGLLGLRMAHEMQIPSLTDQKFTDNKGNTTIVKKDTVANGNYRTSEGKTGDSVWSTRAAWCEAFGKMGKDSISIVIFDHPSNINYPTYWHARGYGLFAANPLGEKIFTNGRSSRDLKLKKGESIRFVYRIRIQNGAATPSTQDLNKIAGEFYTRYGKQ